ncbi:ribulose-bisphosphate carboxylase large subunit family protein [Flavimaricola marinus]|uniref:Ribulose bisphosphate carboxylase-like protein n=1 Tax=Flavimaricola marinus TaxID=1819565 RepID=A0A238LJY2_9RHOB|nr:ribulose-bisphosphate carboxylase large subunit family protein [Flavimaricola marinus]SMY09981.1 Ribulose bisphosphate carboxylase-like protein [Flavimaricola marinus]
MTRIFATYDIETPVGLAHAADVLAGEQSTGTFVKLASETDELRARSAARVENIRTTSSSNAPSLPSRKTGNTYERGLVTVSWPLNTVGTSLPTLMSTIAGNLFELAEISAIRLTAVQLPKEFGRDNPGPQFGAEGTRAFMGGHTGPLIGTIIKPSVGLRPSETAELVKALVDAGIDFIKDDELQANGPDCPFGERLSAVMRVINDHAEKSGKRVIYAANITDEIDQMWRNLDLMQSVGAFCAMVCLQSVGLSGVRAVRNHSEALIHGHRAGWGLLSRSPDIGVSFDVMQKLWRLAGADHLHVNGLGNKFTESDEVVAESARSVRRPTTSDHSLNDAAMPVFSSGQTIWQIAPSRKVVGNDDFIFCAGGGIMSHPGGPGQGVTALRAAAEAARDGVSLDEMTRQSPALQIATQFFKRPSSP